MRIKVQDSARSNNCTFKYHGDNLIIRLRTLFSLAHDCFMQIMDGLEKIQRRAMKMINISWGKQYMRQY